jgi:SOS-response transcriptional repressor LexA
VRARIEADGIAPSYDEISKHLEIRSRGNINRIVTDLVERGMLNRIPGKARALSVPDRTLGTGFIVNPVPEIRHAVEVYAAQHGISIRTAAEEAMRAYFMGPWSQ